MAKKLDKDLSPKLERDEEPIEKGHTTKNELEELRPDTESNGDTDLSDASSTHGRKKSSESRFVHGKSERRTSSSQQKGSDEGYCSDEHDVRSHKLPRGGDETEDDDNESFDVGKLSDIEDDVNKASKANKENVIAVFKVADRRYTAVIKERKGPYRKLKPLSLCGFSGEEYQKMTQQTTEFLNSKDLKEKKIRSAQVDDIILFASKIDSREQQIQQTSQASRSYIQLRMKDEKGADVTFWCSLSAMLGTSKMDGTANTRLLNGVKRIVETYCLEKNSKSRKGLRVRDKKTGLYKGDRDRELNASEQSARAAHDESERTRKEAERTRKEAEKLDKEAKELDRQADKEHEKEELEAERMSKSTVHIEQDEDSDEDKADRSESPLLKKTPAQRVQGTASGKAKKAPSVKATKKTKQTQDIEPTMATTGHNADADNLESSSPQPKKSKEPRELRNLR